MDEVNLILMAIAAGVSAGAKDVAGQAVRDAYGTLKRLLEQRFAGRSEAQMALTQFEAKPDVWRAPLVEALRETAASQDAEILALAHRIIAIAGAGSPPVGVGSVTNARDVATTGGRNVSSIFHGQISGSTVVSSAGDITGPLFSARGLAAGEIAALFEHILSTVRSRQADPNVDNTEIQQTVERIRDEASIGEQANPNKLQRWIGWLRSNAADIADAVDEVLQRSDVTIPRTALQSAPPADEMLPKTLGAVDASATDA